MGFAGNCEPNFIIPSIIGVKEAPKAGGVAPGKAAPSSTQSATAKGAKTTIDDLDFFIGDEALANSSVYACKNPIKHGQVEDWTLMEQFWEQCIFKYLRSEPEDHYFLLVCFYNLPFIMSYTNTHKILLFRLNHLLMPQKTENTLPRSCSKLLTFQDCTLLSKPFLLWLLHGLLNKSLKKL